MNQTLVDRIVNAVLYEGYILYPYRPSVKNRQRWTFGGLVPESFSLAQGGTEAWTMQTECLAAADARGTLAVTVRFLHLVERQVGQLTEALTQWPADREPSWRDVESLEVGGRRHYRWQEAEERSVCLPAERLGDYENVPRRERFRFPSRRSLEPLSAPTGEIVGVIVRRQQAVEGEIEVLTEKLAADLYKMRVRILNRTPLENAERIDRDTALLSGLVSTHTLLEVHEGEWVSMIDPPEPWRAFASDCRNEGAWPVLVGANDSRDTMLSSPIILYDYPQIAPESAGDFFDATEVDEMLTLRVMTLTEEEKQAMASVDERVRALLQRTDSLGKDQMLGLHGAVRDLRLVETEAGHD